MWRLAFPNASIAHLGAINSDHAHILLETNPEDTFAHRPFRFEAVWIRDDRCTAVVEKAWNEEVRGSDFVKLYKKQAGTRDALCKWNKKVFGNCQSRINLLLQKIKDIQSNNDSADNGFFEATLQSELSEWLLRSEILWRQKSRELRLKEGDKNSKFFHLSTIIRRRHNHIDAVKGENGNWVTGSNRIREKFLQHFKELYKEEEVSFPDHLDNLIRPCITDDENSDLCCTPTPEEIRLTLFNMQDLKAPGPDGFPVLFYKEYWPTVGNDVIKAVTSFFNFGNMPKEVNNSLIILIPKISNPSSMDHYRPMSLCNVIYKIISKLLVNKIRPLLHKIISPCQSAFVPDRWIAENQVIVQEMLHSFKTRKVKTGLMAIKLDLQKAYDKVNWKFIQSVLRRFGFRDIFISWITACLSSMSFEVIVNGGKSKQFKPSRGLRQGALYHHIFSSWAKRFYPEF